jgi:hypothetical protein
LVELDICVMLTVLGASFRDLAGNRLACVGQGSSGTTVSSSRYGCLCNGHPISVRSTFLIVDQQGCLSWTTREPGYTIHPHDPFVDADPNVLQYHFPLVQVDSTHPVNPTLPPSSHIHTVSPHPSPTPPSCLAGQPRCTPPNADGKRTRSLGKGGFLDKRFDDWP